MLLEIFVAVCLVFVLLKVFAVTTNGVAKSHVCLVGKTVLITGGNRGIGYETALNLAARGCRLIIADVVNAEESRKAIIRETGNTNVVTKKFDLASFDSIRRFAEDIKNTEDRLDILINNAGIGGNDEGVTIDGNTRMMQINHLGPFLLTHLLIDLLKKHEGTKIIFVSSFLAFFHNLTTDNLNDFHKILLHRYGNTKMCNVITTKVLSKKLQKYGITVNCLHPGMVYTQLFDYKAFQKLPTFYGIMYKILWCLLVVPFSKTSEEGAQTTIHLALSKTCKNTTGRFFMDCKVFFDPPKANDEEFCDGIFQKSEELSGLRENEKV